MGFRTNPDRILENIDRARSRESDAPRAGTDRQATVRELDSEIPDLDATNPERMKRIFRLVEQAYTKVAQSQSLGPLAARFQAVGDLHAHHAHGDVSLAFAWLDAERTDDIALSPFEIRPDEVQEAKKETKTSRPDVNAMKVLRKELREGVLAAYKKIEPRLREAMRERADLGAVAVTVTVDVRPAGTGLLDEAPEDL